ncbi:MAG: 2-hydroxyacyl-CoA dehydratase family protein, partial [Planctomycetota bacterium]
MPRQITLEEWDQRYEHLQRAGLRQPSYGGPLGRHVEDGDKRLLKLRYDNSAAALRLWNFLLTEEDRLHEARNKGKRLVGTMKDLGTVPVMAYSFDKLAAFYPDGAWWIPCVMELDAGLLEIADSLGIDESFCPVRAMLGAFVTGAHFPIPELLTCSVGATCDDFSAIAQRLNSLGYPILWWEVPHRRSGEPDEATVRLPGGFSAPKCQVEFVKSELVRLKTALEELAGEHLDDKKLSAGIKKANLVRTCLAEIRQLAFTAELCPMPALEMLIAEMLA